MQWETQVLNLPNVKPHLHSHGAVPTHLEEHVARCIRDNKNGGAFVQVAHQAGSGKMMGNLSWVLS